MGFFYFFYQIVGLFNQVSGISAESEFSVVYLDMAKTAVDGVFYHFGIKAVYDAFKKEQRKKAHTDSQHQNNGFSRLFYKVSPCNLKICH